MVRSVLCWLFAIGFWAAPSLPTYSVIVYTGALGSSAVDPAFAAATASQTKQTIDFDGDGFVLAPNAFTPISSNYYSSQGVTLLNLDARSVGSNPWAHSLPIGAWHTGFRAFFTRS